MKTIQMSMSELLERVRGLKESQKKDFSPYRQVHLEKFQNQLKKRQPKKK